MTISTQEVQKLLLEWKEELKKEKERKQIADTISQDASVKINMIDGALQFGEMLLKKPETTGVVDIGTRATSKRTKR
tara:strand:+ start:497 stop:727 length:231 start_codon:yes stop_codon:yes gene_type:complete